MSEMPRGFTPEEKPSEKDAVEESQSPQTMDRRTLLKRAGQVGLVAAAAGAGLGISNEASAHSSATESEPAVSETDVRIGGDTIEVTAEEQHTAEQAWATLEMSSLKVDFYKIHTIFGGGDRPTAPEEAEHLYKDGEHFRLSYEYESQPTDPIKVAVTAFALCRDRASFAAGDFYLLQPDGPEMDLGNMPEVEEILKARDFYTVVALMENPDQAGSWLAAASTDVFERDVLSEVKPAPVIDEIKDEEQPVTAARPVTEPLKVASFEQNPGLKAALKPAPLGEPALTGSDMPATSPRVGAETSWAGQGRATTVDSPAAVVNPKIGYLPPEAGGVPAVSSSIESQSASRLGQIEQVGIAATGVAAAVTLAKNPELRQSFMSRVRGLFGRSGKKNMPPTGPMPEAGMV